MKIQVYIFGAGKNGQSLLEYMEETGVIEVAAFIDNNPDKQKEKIQGIACISLEEAVRRGAQQEIICVSVSKGDEVENQLRNKGFVKVICVGAWVEKRRTKDAFFKPVICEESDYGNVKPFNYYESPYPDIVEIHRQEKEIFDINKEILGIDLNADRQLELVKRMEEIELPGWQANGQEGGYRYYYENGWFDKNSADALYYMIRLARPKNIIEVGSGFSTSVMLDTNERYFNNEINIVSIEPYCERLKSLLRPSDNLRIYEKDLQKIPLDFFDTLGEDDILFIDSSHVSKINSDVNYVFFEILPRLKKGVYVHFHDIIYPFIYPAKWIYEGRAYSEMYLLRAFLMGNKEFSIQLFGGMLDYKYGDRMTEKLRGIGKNSMWLRKEA